MDKHDDLARRMIGKDELSRTHSSLPELSPLDQLIAKARVRWPFPEMGKLEYLDWRETLNLYPLNEIQGALNYIMQNPQKRDGEEYRGRPSLVDVTRTIAIIREDRASERMRNEGKRITDEMRKLQADRDAHPEKYFGVYDLAKAVNELGEKKVMKPMPEVKTVWPDFDPMSDAKQDELKRKAKEVADALLRQERARASAGDRDE